MIEVVFSFNAEDDREQVKDRLQAQLNKGWKVGGEKYEFSRFDGNTVIFKKVE